MTYLKDIDCYLLIEHFIGYYDVDKINTRIKFVRKPIRAGKDWVMWKEPEKGKQYVLGCDVASQTFVCSLLKDPNHINLQFTFLQDGKESYEWVDLTRVR